MLELLADIVTPLAARSSDEKGSGWIFGLIFVAIWLIFGAISSAAKKNEQERRERLRRELEGTPVIPPPLPTAQQHPHARVPVPQGPVGGLSSGGDPRADATRLRREAEMRQLAAREQQRLQAQRSQQQQQRAEQQRREREARQRQQSRPSQPQQRRAAPTPAARRAAPAQSRLQEAGTVQQTLAAPLPATKQDISATEIRSAGEGARAARLLSANAESLNRWLRPATLRQQFILTEVLQPPLALRQDRTF